jgi:trk system potassium uptake protein TrkH
LMFVGGASGSTAGGIKIQTFSLLYFAIISAVRGHRNVEAFRREVPIADVLRAIAVALLSLALIFMVTFALTVTERFTVLQIMFEAFSAFGTVGLSTGITPETTPAGRVILILTMFAGRLGPLTLVLALTARERRTVYHWPEEAIKIG